jgi:23S rRNA U2552 (ribose-2'-O)-methylase RlmE/FtsJ
LPGVEPIQLDITDPESVARAASVASDVNVVINDAADRWLVCLHEPRHL